MTNFPCFKLAMMRFVQLITFGLMLDGVVFADDFGDLRITVETVLVSASAEGYDEYRATIINRSPSSSHQVAIVLFDHGWGGPEDLIRREIEIGPSASMTITLFSPPWHNGNRAGVWIDGVRQNERIEIDSSRTSAINSRSQNRYFLLISRDADKASYFDSKPVTDGFSAIHSTLDVAYSLSSAAPSEWSPHWLGYSGFSAVALTAEEISAMPEASRQALIRYTETGGVLIVIGRWTPPASWNAGIVPAYEMPTTPAPSPAPVDAESEDPDSKQILIALSNRSPNNLKSYEIGFGLAVVTGDFPFEQITAGQWMYLKAKMRESEHASGGYYSLSMLNKKFPLVDRLGVPVRGLFALILGFILLIGPINFFWLAGPGKKMRILWTVPLISLLTCLAVAGFSLYGEGTQATERIESFTVLNDIDHRAATIGMLGYYSPIATDGLHFSQDVEISQLTWDGSNRDKLTIDFSNDQHLGPGWIPPRVPRFLHFRKSEVRRERLSIRLSNEGVPRVDNGIGVPIKQLWVKTPAGQMFLADNIEAGAQASLRAVESPSVLAPMPPNSLFQSNDWIEDFKKIEQNPNGLVKQGCYLAIVDRNPFVESALGNVSNRRGRSFIYGGISEATK